ncbi:MAG: tetratricopeptide repeat protein [Bacteroidia bacterium]|nr:tetratricopeptide repeat protein [Bacteroidia bacterium]
MIHLAICLMCLSYRAQNATQLIARWDSLQDGKSTAKPSLHGLIKDFENKREWNGLCDTYRRLGILYRNEGRTDSAIIAYIKSIKLADSIGYTSSSASSNNQLGSLYYELNDPKRALTYFSQAFYLYGKAKSNRGASDAALNMAEIYLELGNRTESMKLNLESMRYRRARGDTSEMGYNYDLLSRQALNDNAFNKALAYSQRANQLFRASNDAAGLMPGLIQQALCLENLNKNDSALRFYQKSYSLAKQYQYKKYIAQALKGMAGVFEKIGLKDSAYFYLSSHTIYQDSLHLENIEDATIKEAARYETEKIETNLKNEKLLSAKMTQQLYILAGLILVLIITIVLMVRNFRQRKKIQEKQSELNNANAMIEGQDAERERIARELHDRVGSMLSTVKLQVTSMDEQMSSLILQHGESYKKVIHLLDDTYDEVRRISHDLDSGLLSRFGFKTAMMQLVQLLESTNKLKVMYIDNGVDPSVYKAFETDLYRITQELLSNAIKYASAKEISLQLSINNGNLLFSYEDDGVGFDKTTLEEKKGIGYKNIDTRVKKMKGTWHLDTSVGHGTNLIIEIPLNAKI